jgi:trans-aconitate 2-methyltransferase
MVHEFDGSKYREGSTHQKEWGTRLIGELSLLGNERVLDLGCGDGALTARIAELVPRGHVVGVDASQGMIKVASAKSKENLTFLLMDIHRLDFDEEFDVVFSNATLHWLKNHRPLLANIRKSLRKGGLLRVNFAGDGNCRSFFKVIRETMAIDDFAPFFSGFAWPWYMPSVDEYSSLARESHFSAVDVWGENADQFFPSETEMIKWIDQPSLVPFLAVVPEGMKPRLRDHVVRRMIEETRQDDGTCFETFRRINVKARK